MTLLHQQESGRCPNCGRPLRDLERIEERHVPASVPEHLEREAWYVVTHRKYTLVKCENDHRFKASGGKGPLGWRELRGMAVAL